MREKRQGRPSGEKAAGDEQPRFDFVMERFGSIGDMDRSFDIEYLAASGGRCDLSSRVGTR